MCVCSCCFLFQFLSAQIALTHASATDSAFQCVIQCLICVFLINGRPGGLWLQNTVVLLCILVHSFVSLVHLSLCSRREKRSITHRAFLEKQFYIPTVDVCNTYSPSNMTFDELKLVTAYLACMLYTQYATNTAVKSFL